MTKTQTPFEQGLGIATNGMSPAIYNLICTKRDLTLYVKCGIKPHHNWKVTDVKRYFGITGSKQKLLDNFMEIYNQHAPSKQEN